MFFFVWNWVYKKRRKKSPLNLTCSKNIQSDNRLRKWFRSSDHFYCVYFSENAMCVFVASMKPEIQDDPIWTHTQKNEEQNKWRPIDLISCDKFSGTYIKTGLINIYTIYSEALFALCIACFLFWGGIILRQVKSISLYRIMLTDYKSILMTRISYSDLYRM